MDGWETIFILGPDLFSGSATSFGTEFLKMHQNVDIAKVQALYYDNSLFECSG